ncbi:hypothetical protein P279_23720 [Rhodobacteraceae bacterium PD-2]|nr:hypothetical protein P279_23720 [Rhodobacteraceae bacterium PD-2]
MALGTRTEVQFPICSFIRAFEAVLDFRQLDVKDLGWRPLPEAPARRWFLERGRYVLSLLFVFSTVPVWHRVYG